MKISQTNTFLEEESNCSQNFNPIQKSLIIYKINLNELYYSGGTGFIGTHLTNLIKDHYPNAQVYNLDIVKPGTPNPVVKDYKPALRDGQKLQSTFIEYDIRKPIENLPFTPTEDDVIFNFAAVHRTPGHEDHEYFETNIRGAENVEAFAEKWNIKKIVFTSSIAPYGAAEELKKETTLPTPNTAYGISKLVAEKIHEKWQNGDATHRQLTIVRPGVVFGKGEKLKNCGYQFKWSFEEVLADWFEDNDRKGLK